MTTSNTKIPRESATASDVSAWYMNGTLSEEDQGWAQSLLEDSEQGREELRFDRDIEQELRAEMAEIPADLGWETLLSKTRSQSAHARQSTQRTAAAPSRLSGWLDKLFSPAMGMAMAAIIAVQAVTMVAFYPGSEAIDTVDYRSPGAVQQVDAIRAIFVESMTESRMREVLVDNNLRIVDGPTPFGEYVLYGADESLATIASKLKADGILAHYSLDQISKPAQ